MRYRSHAVKCRDSSPIDACRVGELGCLITHTTNIAIAFARVMDT